MYFAHFIWFSGQNDWKWVPVTYVYKHMKIDVIVEMTACIDQLSLGKCFGHFRCHGESIHQELSLTFCSLLQARMKRTNELDADRVQTHAGHSIAWNIVLYVVTLWPWPLTLWPNIKWVARTYDGLCLWQVNLVIAVSAVFVLSRPIVRTNRQTDTHTQTNADERFTPATVVSVNKERTNGRKDNDMVTVKVRFWVGI